MAIPKVKYQHYTFTVTALGQVVNIDADTDKLYNTCTGINALLTDDMGVFSTLSLDINGVEIFPENFEVLRIQFRRGVPFGYEYHRLKEPAGGSKIKGKYTDVIGATYPYTVTLSFRLENIDPADTGKID